MNMPKYKIYYLGFLAIAISLATSLLPAHTETNKLNVGAILPLTGEFAYVGADIRSGLDSCLEELKLNEQVVINYQDSKTFDRQQTVSAYRTILTKRAELVLTSTINEVKPIEPIVERSKIPLVMLWDKYRSSKKSKYIKSIGFSVEASAEHFAEYAFKTLKLRKIAIISVLDEWSVLVTQAFIQKFTEIGGTIVVQKEVSLEESNLIPHLLKAKALEADSFFLPLYSNSLLSALRQIKNLHLTQIILTPEGLTDPVINELGKPTEGVYTYRPVKPAIGKALAKNKIPAQSDPGFYGMGVSACRLVKEYLLSKRIRADKKTHLQSIGVVRDGTFRLIN